MRRPSLGNISSVMPRIGAVSDEEGEDAKAENMSSSSHSAGSMFDSVNSLDGHSANGSDDEMPLDVREVGEEKE